MALSLKKEVSFLNEVLGIESSLHHLKMKESYAIDFLIVRKNLPAILIEVKLSDDTSSKSFSAFEKYFPKCLKIQLVKNLNRQKQTLDQVHLISAVAWLESMDLGRAEAGL